MGFTVLQLQQLQEDGISQTASSDSHASSSVEASLIKEGQGDEDYTQDGKSN